MGDAAVGRRILDAVVGAPLSWIVGSDTDAADVPGELTARSFERLAALVGLRRNDDRKRD